VEYTTLMRVTRRTGRFKQALLEEWAYRIYGSNGARLRSFSSSRRRDSLHMMRAERNPRLARDVPEPPNLIGDRPVAEPCIIGFVRG